MDVTSREPPEPGDRSLAQMVLERGDERAFRTLYRRHTPLLYQFVLRTLEGNEQDAEDVIQETWMRAVENLESFRWEGPLKNWLLGIALNCCRTLFRRKDRAWLELDERFGWSATDGPEEHIDVERALELLPPGYRTVLLLHDLEGYKHHEIAELLGTTAGTSKSQLFHARRSLRSLLLGAAQSR
jgi:RNA polymerase sigma-70 factor (ECF subfamily)